MLNASLLIIIVLIHFNFAIVVVVIVIAKTRSVYPPKSMMHIVFSLLFPQNLKFISFPYISAKLYTFSSLFPQSLCLLCIIYVFLLSPILTITHSCIILYTYWTPLAKTSHPFLCSCLALLYMFTPSDKMRPTFATSTNLTMTLALCCAVVLLSTMHWIHCERPLKSAIERSSFGVSLSDVTVA